MPQSQFRSRTSLTTNKRIISPFFPGERPAPRGFFVSNRLAYLLKNNWKNLGSLYIDRGREML